MVLIDQPSLVPVVWATNPKFVAPDEMAWTCSVTLAIAVPPAGMAMLVPDRNAAFTRVNVPLAFVGAPPWKPVYVLASLNGTSMRLTAYEPAVFALATVLVV